MIGISKLYCGTVEPSDALRYGRHSGSLPSHLLQFSEDKKPVVVWNMTQRCNLKCVHCYAHAKDRTFEGELTTAQGKALIDDLSAFGSPVILFSGGEPTMHPDLPELAQYAVGKGMRAVISTNGTLITEEMAHTLKEIGLSYVGISLDGLETIQICVGYTCKDGKPVPNPVDSDDYEGLHPVYEEVPGWSDSTLGAKTLAELPQAARDYIAKIEAVVGAPIDIISTGPDRVETIVLRHPFEV